MFTKALASHVVLLFATVSALALIDEACVTAQTEQSPISASVTLLTPNTIEQGEPVIVRCDLNNTSATETAGIYTGYEEKAWYSVAATNAAGIQTVFYTGRSVMPDGAYISPVRFLQPKGSFQEDIALSQWLDHLVPGRYTIEVSLRVPMQTFQGNVTPTLTNEERVSESTNVYTEDYSYVLNVLSPNPAQLSETAKRLIPEIKQTSDPYLREAAYDALFAMPPRFVQATWAKLAGEKREAPNVIDELAKHPSTVASDLLLEISEDGNLAQNDRDSATAARNSMMTNTLPQRILN